MSKYTIRAHFPWRVLWRYFALRHLLILMYHLVLQTMGSFCISDWQVWITNTIFTKKKYPCIFYSFQTYFCSQSQDYACTLSVISKWSLPSLWSYLPWWLWRRPKKQVWIIIIIIIKNLKRAFSMQIWSKACKGITYTLYQSRFHGSKIYLQQYKEKSQYIVLKYHIENSAFAYEKLCRSRMKYVIHLGR